MTAESYKHDSLKHNPLSSLPKTLWLSLFGLTQQPRVGAAAYSHTGSLQTTWVHSLVAGLPLCYLHMCSWFFKEVTKSL